jgi:LCP family protein required for cell wall assembly
MPKDPENPGRSGDSDYRVYRGSPRSGGGASGRARSAVSDRPQGQRAAGGGPSYKTYRSQPRGLIARLRGETDAEVGAREEFAAPSRRRGLLRRSAGRRWTPWRVARYVVGLVVAWVLLSLVLFLISSQTHGNLPASARAALSSGPNMLTGTDTVLILGTDQRPRTGPGSKEPGSNYNAAGSRSDTIMLWRIGGGVSRRLSIPRDTLASIPGHGVQKINAGYAIGGPALAIKTVEAFTGVKINHVIVVNLANFVPFINAIGGVDVKTGRVCANISGGKSQGGFTLDLKPGVHHFNGLQALVYARVRENPCNPADSDLTRVQHQQEILNAIRGRLTSLSTFIRLPIASWDAPKVLQTDMGGFTLLSLFAASEIGGNAPVQVLKPTGGQYVPGVGDALTDTPAHIRAAINRLMNG